VVAQEANYGLGAGQGVGHGAEAVYDALGRDSEGAGQHRGAGAYDVLIAYDVEPGQDTTAGRHGGGRAGDGDEVVSIDVRPPDLEAIGTVIDHHRDIRPQEMPSVQVPPGEYGKGAWAPEDIRPDGPPGAVDPERRA
jgi:hypothetical protein